MAIKSKAPKKQASTVTRKPAAKAVVVQKKAASKPQKKAPAKQQPAAKRAAPQAARPKAPVVVHKPVAKAAKAAPKGKAPVARKAVSKPASKVAARKAAVPMAMKLAVRAPYGLNRQKPPEAPSVSTRVGHAKGLTAAEKKQLRAMMLAMRERLSRQVGNLKQESLQQREEIVTSEDGTDAFDRQFALTVASSEQDAIFDIDDAIRRLDAGKYGACEDCGCEIEMPRLKALPFVRLCIRCQSESERNRPRFRPLE
jgi:RNA polymerase-binding protein DksA